ncbi:hypothetical protein LAZ67_2002419 [Cordylochernes scorpioides]|uniref:Transposase n=1 Tax=Cordylochernes scorpioides TaxID=51811 RepID=A0ABY6K6P7_9ARAC|nr:hypothetical protein LAZ67_2002419 [Cordylochernes scorpioides]
MLTEDHKRQRVYVAQKFLDCHKTDGEEFLDSIVTGDVTWVHYTTPETKEQSKQWNHISSPKPLKFKQTLSAGKLMATVFWDRKGLLLCDFMRLGTTINSHRYCKTLKQLRRAIQNKRRGMLTKGVRFHHDNARPHTARQTTALIEEFEWELVSHPPYSPDVAPSDFHFFPELKKNLGGTQFQDDDELEEAVLGFYVARRQSSSTLGSIMYGEECMSIQMVRRWRSWFLEGRQNVHDDERSGSPVTATDNAAVAAVRNVVEADRRVTIDEIMIRLPPGIEIRRSSIGTIMSDVLNFLKVCTRWVPRLLLENHKQQRMEAARAFLEMHQRDGDQLFSRIVTGDESWVHHSTPETKRQSMVWKKPEESAPKKAKVTISAGKVMAMENFKWEIFTHPPYSPELAPSDFHLYPALKWHLGGKHFANDDEVQAEANHWLRRQDTAWYKSGI